MATHARTPTFSVLVTSYQRRDLVLESLRSVLQQTRPPDEVILVVDGSSDGTSAAVREQLPEVRVIEQPNLGRSIAVNTAALASNSTFLCFLDDDDLWHREKLAEVERYLIKVPECFALRNPVWFYTTSQAGPESAYGFERDFVATDLAECHAVVDNGFVSHNDASYLDILGDSYRLQLERNRGAFSSTVVARDLYFRVGGLQAAQTIAEDWLLFLNIARMTEWHTLPRRLGFQRLHPGQMTADLDDGIGILAAKIAVWRTGRPFPESVPRDQVDEKLVAYARQYRDEIQQFLWRALRTRSFRDVRLTRGLATALLPRWRDRAFLWLPPQLTWRYSQTWSRRVEVESQRRQDRSPRAEDALENTF
jgi:glycosyltransferase involved in cell wall biosynthesis